MCPRRFLKRLTTDFRFDPTAWRASGLSKSFISRVIIGVTPFRVLITYLLSPLPLQASCGPLQPRLPRFTGELPRTALQSKVRRTIVGLASAHQILPEQTCGSLDVRLTYK